MNRNRMLSLLLCAMLCLSACGQSEQSTETTANTSDTTEATVADETETPLPDTDFEGGTFTFLGVV